MKLDILGVKIDSVDSGGVLEKISSWLAGQSQHQIVTVNPEFIVAAQGNQRFNEILNSASLATCDGAGLVWAAKILYGQKINRVTGVDLTEKLFSFKNNHKIYLLGGDEGIAQMLMDKFPSAGIVGAYSGGQFLDSALSFQNNEDVIKRINESGANLLLVALTQVKQEIWINDNLPLIPNIKVAIGVGGTFNYLSGRIRRAPIWMRKLGLEWLFRLVSQPKRIGRIYNATIKFSWLVLMKKI